MCIMNLFKKKTSKKWEFGENPVVNWVAKNKSKYDMVTICKLILTQILHIDDVELTVANNDNQIKIFDTSDFELLALLIKQPTSHRYTLLIRSNVSGSELLSIVCHEMWHLEQYYKGDLALNGKIFTWKGKKYDSSIPYFDRPWEKEAIKEQYAIEKKVKKLYYE